MTDADGNRPDWYWTGKSPSEGCPGMQPDGTITHLPLPDLSKVTRQQVLDTFDNSWTITEVLFSGLQGEPLLADACRVLLNTLRDQAQLRHRNEMCHEAREAIKRALGSLNELFLISNTTIPFPPLFQARRSSTALLTTTCATPSSSTTATPRLCT